MGTALLPVSVADSRAGVTGDPAQDPISCPQLWWYLKEVFVWMRALVL